MGAWWKRRGTFSKIAIVVAGLGLFAVLGNSGKTASTTTTTATYVASTPATTAAIIVNTTQTTTEYVPNITDPPIITRAQATVTTEAPPTTVTTAAPQWVKVAALSGKTNKTGDVFELTGAPARMTYGITEGFTAVYIMQDGQNLETDGGFPDVNSMDAIKDSTRLTKDPGSYYLVVRGNSPYTVTIEEQR